MPLPFKIIAEFFSGVSGRMKGVALILIIVFGGFAGIGYAVRSYIVEEVHRSQAASIDYERRIMKLETDLAWCMRQRLDQSKRLTEIENQLKALRP